MTRAVLLKQPGEPDALTVKRSALPPPAAGEIRPRQTAIGVNYHDVCVRSGLYQTLPLPGVPGIEAVGVVEALGNGVEGLHVGDRIGYVSGGYGPMPSNAICLRGWPSGCLPSKTPRWLRR